MFNVMRRAIVISTCVMWFVLIVSDVMIVSVRMGPVVVVRGKGSVLFGDKEILLSPDGLSMLCGSKTSTLFVLSLPWAIS